MMKSKDGITYFIKKMKSGNRYIKLRASVEINGIVENRIVSTGLLATEENLKKIKEEARPLYYDLLGVRLHKAVKLNEFYMEALELININCNAETSGERVSKTERYILPYFGKHDIKKIEAGAIEEWQLLLRKDGVSADMVRRCKSLLNRIFKRAILLNYRTDNPCHATSTVREYRKDVHEIYSREEVVMMVAYADDWLRVFILVFATLWLRSNEIIVLKWSDINWQNKTMNIDRAIRRGEWRKPKTGCRVVEIPDSLYSVLLEWKKSSKGEWIFPNNSGTNYKDASAVNQKRFQPLLQELKIKYRGMYELKHTGISLSFSKSLDSEFIASQAGHKDKSTFIKYYAKFIKDKDNIKKADKILNFNA